MQLREYFHQFIKELKPIYGADESNAISAMLFEHFAKSNRTNIITNPHQILEKDVVNALQLALEQLKNHVPVQQVIGHCRFLELNFIVSPAVLIPRPETAELVHKACEFINQIEEKKILDIGTGSGCIAISIQHLIKNAEVTAIDVSAAALSIAEQNAIYNNTPVRFRKLDFLDESAWEEMGTFNVIISNPPYIPVADKDSMSKNVLDHEPHLALFVADDDPLIFYKKIAAFSTTYLAAGGAVFLETHESYAKQVGQLFELRGFKATVLKDFFEKERMVMAIRNH